MWLLLLACASPPEPPTAAVPVPPPPAPPWTLTGRASSDGLDTPTLIGGAAALGPACATLNERLRGDGPPCFVEEWRSDRVLHVERAGARLRFDGQPGRTTWTQLGGPLDGCLGDPLAVPPAGDPGGHRALDGDSWVLTLSGANRCALGGTLRLHTRRDTAAWSGLTVAGTPWDAGGRERALDVLRAELRDLVDRGWADLDRADRADALRALATDPHPDAKRLLDRRR